MRQTVRWTGRIQVITTDEWVCIYDIGVPHELRRTSRATDVRVHGGRHGAGSKSSHSTLLMRLIMTEPAPRATFPIPTAHHRDDESGASKQQSSYRPDAAALFGNCSAHVPARPRILDPCSTLPTFLPRQHACKAIAGALP